MKMLTPLASALVLGMALTACNKPEEPAKTEADVMRAAAEGQGKVNEAATTAVVEHVEAVADAHEANKPLSEGDLKNDVNNLHTVDTTVADANYKVAKEKCDALTGDAKSACLKEADRVHESDLGQAKAEQKSAKEAISANPPATAPAAPK